MMPLDEVMIKYSNFLFFLGENIMPITTLLSPENAPLTTMKLLRIRLDAEYPAEQIPIQDEICVYPMIGRFQAHIDAVDYGIFGGRQHVCEHDTQALRATSGLLTLTLKSYSADFLLATCTDPFPVAPFVHRNDAMVHTVGSGTHQRIVTELVTPPSYRIWAGETENIPGGVSSWPPHANAEDIAGFRRGETSWEEMMFFVCQEPGIVVLDGYYNDVRSVKSVQPIYNGSAHAMPLGSHTLHAAPNSFLWYAWFYAGTALQKEYRKWATDVGVYRK